MADNTDLRALLQDMVQLAGPAGAAIMSVYQSPAEAEIKSDGSPVTEADRAAEAIILAGLRDLAPDIPVVSEEAHDSHKMEAPERFFLVDPLDGTKEFLRRDGTGSFTVNIALIEKGVPVLGVVYAPALKRLFAGSLHHGATETSDDETRPIAVRAIPASGAVAVASRSHRDEQTDHWLTQRNITQTVSIGSSLKFCLVACGEADVYPRFGPTMEWDTAAGHGVLLAAGGQVTTPDNDRFVYGKPNFRNGPFIAGTAQTTLA
ncbi:MAG: 3'(2'),5'-bisphosphate nucleotidase CysQ [Pseudomonadota bacterium]